MKQAVSLDKGFAQAYNTLGMISLQTGDKQDALGYFKQAISNNINFDEAYTNYQNTAEELGISVGGETADFVFYTVGMPFDGDTVFTKGLGGSETALTYMARELAGMTKYEFGKLLGKRQITRHYTDEDLQDDIAYSG